MSNQTFTEKAKAKAIEIRDKSKEALKDFAEQKPCVQCGTKEGNMRYTCSQCATANFCHKCADYCVVRHSEVPVYTTREKATEAAHSAKEKSVELYQKALEKFKNRKQNKAEAEAANAASQNIDAAETTSTEGTAAPAAEDPNRPKEEQYSTGFVCRLCFRNSVQTLDINRSYDIIGPFDGDIQATIIACHAGGNSRASLRRMANQLIGYNIRTILVDLPGHGGRMDEPLSTETALEVLHNAATTLMTEATAKDTKAGLLLLMGVGLGGYLAMEYLGRASPGKFDGAIIVNAGAGVGRDEASLLSRAALSVATAASTHLGAKTFTNAALREIKKTHALIKEDVFENLIDCGFYFNCATEQLNILKSTTSKVALGRFFGPILYMDGSKDFHDMVDTYTKISVDNELRSFRRGADGEDGVDNDDDTAEGGLIILSRSLQYPSGTKLFLHDSRFADEASADVAVFVQQLASRADLVARNPHLMLSVDEMKAIVQKEKNAADAAAAAEREAAIKASNVSFMEKAKGSLDKAKVSGAGLFSRFMKKKQPAEDTNAAANDTTTAAAAPSNGESADAATRASTASVVPSVAYADHRDEEVVTASAEPTPTPAPTPVIIETPTPAATLAVEEPTAEEEPASFPPVEEEAAPADVADTPAPVDEVSPTPIAEEPTETAAAAAEESGESAAAATEAEDEEASQQWGNRRNKNKRKGGR